MAFSRARLLLKSRIGTNWHRKQVVRTNSYTPKTLVKEFPDLKLDNRQPRDHVIILPEALDEKPENNELLRLPKYGERDIEFDKLDVESVFKGLSQTIANLENFTTDIKNGTLNGGESLKEFLENLERIIFPLDTAHSIVISLCNIDYYRYKYSEIYQLLLRCSELRKQCISKDLRSTFQRYVPKNTTLSEIEKRVLHLYDYDSLVLPSLLTEEQYNLNQYKEFIKRDTTAISKNIEVADSLFKHTIDDPDILAAIASDFEDCTNLHHKERTPLTVTITTYDKFMKLCPDRFIRQNLWQMRNKRCSPKALPQLNNIHMITNLRTLRRKHANALGFRNHVELKMQETLSKSRNELVENLKILNETNRSLLNDRLQELNDFAADNSFEDPSQLGIQEYDVDYWTNRYAHEVVLGKDESDLKAFFPLSVVIEGISSYFNNYLGIELRRIDTKSSLWSRETHTLEVLRKNQIIGKLIYDPFQSASKVLLEPSYGQFRGRSKLFGSLPFKFISTSFKKDLVSKQVLLSSSDIINLFYIFGTVIQSFLYNYDYYEMNIRGCLEKELTEFLPNLCIAHLLSDHRILQACSDRGGSKSIDSDLTCRLLKAITYFRSFKIWQELYKAHLDLELNSNTSDLKNIADTLYSIYSPFARDADNYDYCAMPEILVGPNDGTQYSSILSKQIVNFCLTKLLSQSETTNISSLDQTKIKEWNESLIDVLFDEKNFDTNQKLSLFLGSRFEPLKTDLGVL